MSFFKYFSDLGRATDKDLSRIVESVTQSVAREESSLSRGIFESILADPRFEKRGLETLLHDVPTEELARLLKRGELKEFGDLTKIAGLANATTEQIEALVASLRREQVADIFLKDSEKVADRVRGALDETVEASHLTDMSSATRNKLEEMCKKVDDLRGVNKASRLGTFLKIGAGVGLFTYLELAREAKIGCWVSQTNGNETTSCKLESNQCKSSALTNYDVCGTNITRTLVSPFYKFLESQSIRDKIQQLSGETWDGNDAEAYLTKHGDLLNASVPEILEPLENFSFACDHQPCGACNSSASIYSPSYLSSTNDTLKISCVSHANLFDTLIDLAGTAAAAVVDPVIDAGGKIASKSWKALKPIALVLLAVFAVVVSVMAYLKYSNNRAVAQTAMRSVQPTLTLHLANDAAVAEIPQPTLPPTNFATVEIARPETANPPTDATRDGFVFI